MTLEEILTKRKTFSAGTRVMNCVSHMNKPIDDRPEDCRLCHADQQNFIRYVLRVNEFCNELLDAAEQCLYTDPPSALPSVVESKETAGG